MLPKLGRMPIEDIDQNDIRAALAPIWHDEGRDGAEGHHPAQGGSEARCGHGPRVDLQATDKARVLLGKSRQTTEHIAALPWRGPTFYARLIEDSICHLALRLLILTAARSAEVRFARLDEIEGDTWIIPAARMKAGVEHRFRFGGGAGGGRAGQPAAAATASCSRASARA